MSRPTTTARPNAHSSSSSHIGNTAATASHRGRRLTEDEVDAEAKACLQKEPRGQYNYVSRRLGNNAFAGKCVEREKKGHSPSIDNKSTRLNGGRSSRPGTNTGSSSSPRSSPSHSKSSQSSGSARSGSPVSDAEGGHEEDDDASAVEEEDDDIPLEVLKQFSKSDYKIEPDGALYFVQSKAGLAVDDAGAWYDKRGRLVKGNRSPVLGPESRVQGSADDTIRGNWKPTSKGKGSHAQLSSSSSKDSAQISVASEDSAPSKIRIIPGMPADRELEGQTFVPVSADRPHVRVASAGWHQFSLQLPQLPELYRWYVLYNVWNPDLELGFGGVADDESSNKQSVYELRVNIRPHEVQQMTFLALSEGKITSEKVQMAARAETVSSFVHFSFRVGVP